MGDELAYYPPRYEGVGDAPDAGVYGYEEGRMAAQMASSRERTGFLRRILGHIDPHSRYKGLWAIMRVVFLLCVLVTFGLAVAWRADSGSDDDDDSQSYSTLFTWLTDFYTTNPLHTERVVQEIQLVGVQQSTYVASWLLVIPCILIGTYLLAWAIAAVTALSTKGWLGFQDTLSEISGTLHSSPGDLDTSLWLTFEDMLVTPWIWGGMMLVFGERFIWFIYTVMGLGVAARGFALVVDQDNALSVEQRDAAFAVRDMKDYEYQGLKAEQVTVARRVRPAGLLLSIAITIIGWVLIIVYGAKFPNEPRPTYYIALLVIEVVCEFLQFIIIPLIFYGVWIFSRLHDRREVYGRTWDRYTMDGVCLFLFAVRIFVFEYLVRYGDTGHLFTPRI